MIASAGSGLIAIFIPLLLLDKGLELHQVCLFYFAYSSSKIVTDIASFAILHKYGSGLALAWGYILGFIFSMMLSFYVTDIAPDLLYVMPVFMAFQNSLLWSATHLHIATQMDISRKSRDLATMANASRAAAVATPFIGGLVAATFGATWLAALAAVVSAAAVLPIWPIRNKVDDIPTQKVELSLRNAPLRDLAGNFGFNIHASVGVYVWPIYLAVFIPNFRSIGLITAIATAFGVVVLQLVGRRGDNGKSFSVLAEGTGASSLVHIGRMAASSNPITITIVSALYDLALDYQSNAWTSLYYAHTRKRFELYCQHGNYWQHFQIIPISSAQHCFLLYAKQFLLHRGVHWGRLCCLALPRNE